MYDRTLELITESSARRRAEVRAKLATSKLGQVSSAQRSAQQQLKARLMDKFGAAPKPQPSRDPESRDPEAKQDLARLARVKKQHSNNPIAKIPGLRRLATAVRDRRSERIMKARGMDPVTGKIRPELASDPRSRLEKAVMKRGETIPQYLFQKLRKGLSTTDAASAPKSVF